MIKLDIEKPYNVKENVLYYKLTNGLQMIILQNKSEDKTSQFESIALGIKNGSMKDNKFPGLAHLIEHMMLLVKQKINK